MQTESPHLRCAAQRCVPTTIVVTSAGVAFRTDLLLSRTGALCHPGPRWRRQPGHSSRGVALCQVPRVIRSQGRLIQLIDLGLATQQKSHRKRLPGR